MDDTAYTIYQNERLKAFEADCKQCGKCCGSQDDPCANLISFDSGKYLCKVYGSRLGTQTTISGKKFTCVSIRQHIAAGTLRDGCGYR
jgi:hypothetical protein